MKSRVRSFFSLPALLVILGLLHGLIYVFLIPPWQHNDEPGHFEYVWLIANRSTWPQVGDYDQKMRRDVLLSMYENNFFKGMKWEPDINAEVPWIGLSQVGDPPVYYLLAALPLRFLHGSGIEVQLYASRLISLALYLTTILFGWAIMAELTRPGHFLRWMVPISIALLPGFVDMMTAVNSEVGAVAAVSFFLWAAIYLLRRGPSVIGIFFIIVAVGLCYWTNSTAWITLLLLPIVIFFTIMRRGRARGWAWLLLLTSAVVCAGTMFTWSDATLWYRRTLQNLPTRVANSLSPVGTHAFQVAISKQKGNTSIQQPLPKVTAQDLGNEKLTIGAWVWSSQPMELIMPGVGCEYGNKKRFVFTTDIRVTAEPEFHQFTLTLPADVHYVWVTIPTPVDKKGSQGNVYYDGLVLVKGEFTSLDAPIFEDPNGERGSWSGQPFINLLRNSSAEQAGPGFRSWANELIKKFLPPFPVSYPTDISVSLMDTKGAGWYYWSVFAYMFHSFWGRFGWTNVVLLGNKPYRPLVLASILGLLGAAFSVWRLRRKLPWEAVLLLGFTLAGIWGQAIIRGIGSIFGSVFIPNAHYAFPAMIPSLIILNTGWAELLRLPARWFSFPVKVRFVLHLVFFLVYDILSVVTIAHYYYW
jgi:hypothetical protein